MLERIRKALIESFVGAIAIGVLIANAILSFVSSFTIPFAGWITEWIRQARGDAGYATPIPQFPFLQQFLREGVTAILLLLVAFLLLRWLYMEPAPKPHAPEEDAPEESA